MREFNLLFITGIHQQESNLKKIDFNSFDYVFCAGDFLDSAVPDLELAKELVCMLPQDSYLIPGNHDKPEELRLLMSEKTIYIEKIVTIENFIGERHPRSSKIVGDAKVQVKGDEVIITGVNKEDVGQTMANLEQATKIRGKDPRVFQDGIYLTSRE